MTSNVTSRHAKNAIDSIIKKSRVHLYKPIQIAEILYHHRLQSNNAIDLDSLESYRTQSKKWRDDVCSKLLNRVSTSSAKFQDNLFENNAVPPSVLSALGLINKNGGGIVEAYIYNAFEEKYLQLDNALSYCVKNSKDTFSLSDFLSEFWDQPGLKRSLDKIFEIVVYSLFEVLAKTIEIKIDIHFNPEKSEILKEFSDFSQKVLNLSPDSSRKTFDGHFYRVGVTNAADRGLDMYANFGSVVQIKHLSLDEELAENVVTSITSDKIIIVCKDIEKKAITSLLSQIGWRSRIQSIITISDLVDWYNKALTGSYSNIIGDQVIETLLNEIKAEFPSVGDSYFQEFKENRGYNKIDISKFV